MIWSPNYLNASRSELRPVLFSPPLPTPFQGSDKPYYLQDLSLSKKHVISLVKHEMI